MNDIKIFKKVDTIRPTMIAGWPGMGNVALGAIEYLKKGLEAKRFAEIVIDPSTALDSMAVEDGLARFPDPPKNTFYYSKDSDIIIFEGEAQLIGHAGIELLNQVLDIAVQFKVARIYTGAAFPMPLAYKDASEVYVAANKPELRDLMETFGVKLMEGGHISGLNGLLLGFAEKRKIDAICLLATIPQYALSIPNPRASLAIIEVLSKALNFKVELHDLNEYIKEIDEKMSMIEDKVKDVFSAGEEKREKPREKQPREKKIPGYVRDKIEKMFQEAKLDKKKAMVLKHELDRWDLYKAFEDRFLDLFKDTQ